MSCKFQSWEDGKCEIFDAEIEMNGCDEDGICICSDDPDPSVMCEDWDDG